MAVFFSLREERHVFTKHVTRYTPLVPEVVTTIFTELEGAYQGR